MLYTAGSFRRLSPSVEVISSSDLEIRPTASGWNLREPTGLELSVRSLEVVGHRPDAVSFPLAMAPPKATGFRFPPPVAWPDAMDSAADTAHDGAGAMIGSSSSSAEGESSKDSSLGLLSRKTITRVRPPDDVVRMEDRLLCLLQPPLEDLLSRGGLTLPLAPFPYQMQGIAFLYPRARAILADEMGLGKTMQAIVAMRLLFHQRAIRRALVVCPKPLVTNWRRELAQWAPELPVHVIEGPQVRRRWQWSGGQPGVALVNYESVVRDREAIDAAPKMDLVVIDEAQRIKNLASATSGAVRAIARRRSWALTGTPVENSPDDLVGIFEFLSPGYLRPGVSPRRLGRAASGYVLRRNKEAVLTDLPPKLYRDAQVELHLDQRHSYDLAKEQGVVHLSEMGDQLTIQHVFELILRLKQICNFDPVTGASAKLARLEADLEECAESGRKAIVFSQWVGTLNALDERLSNFGPLLYHGRIPPKERERTVARFRDDPKRRVLLMSYGAGSVGLNLQCASYVFLFDRWWNPAVEDQAIARAHRIGSSRPVTITRFLAADTIEQRIDDILSEKRALIETVLSGAKPGHDCRLTQDEILGLFNLPGA
jgi:SNF2 family DNA or RNA helicase